MEASSNRVDSSFFKSLSPGVGLGYNWGSIFFIGIYSEKTLKIFSESFCQKSCKLCGSNIRQCRFQNVEIMIPVTIMGRGRIFTYEYIEKKSSSQKTISQTNCNLCGSIFRQYRQCRFKGSRAVRPLDRVTKNKYLNFELVFVYTYSLTYVPL